MLQAEFKLKLGQDEILLKAEVADEKDLFEKLSFYSSLPKTAPNGATDLRLVFRQTKEGHKYYSIVSDLEKVEFKFGLNKPNNGGGLFPKGWGPVFEGNENTEDGAYNAAPIGGATVNPGVVIGAPAMPTPAPTPIARPAMSAKPQAVAPVAATVNPQTQAMASNVLARFGVKK